MGATLREMRKTLEAKQNRLQAIFDQATANSEVDTADGAKGQKRYDWDAVKEFENLADGAAKMKEVKRLNLELNDLADEAKGLAEVEAADRNVRRIGEDMDKPDAGHALPRNQPGDVEPKSLGELFTDSKSYQDWTQQEKGAEYELKGVDPRPLLQTKTLFQTSDGWAPETTRTGKVIGAATAQPVLMDGIPRNTTSQAAVVFMYEDTFTNAAAEASEGEAFGEAAIGLTEQSLTIRKVATFLPMTDEQLEDVTYAQRYVTSRLTLMMNQRAEQQVLVGDGNAPNMLGVLNWNVGQSSIQTQALGTDNVPDAVHKAMTLARVTGRAEPSLAVFHPNDWQTVKLLRDGEDRYLYGGPADPGPNRIWGLPVIQTTYETENTGLVGDWAGYSEFVMKAGITFKISDSHDDYFTKGKQALRCTFRAVLVIYRGYAFAKITGI